MLTRRRHVSSSPCRASDINTKYRRSAANGDSRRGEVIPAGTPLADPAPPERDRTQDRPHSPRTTDAHHHRLFGAPRQSPKEGLKQELASGYAAALVAAMSKSLALINKSPAGVRATKNRSALQSLLSWCRAGRAE